MKKLVLITIALLLVVGLMPASAETIEDVTALARFYPANTTVFAATRIDSGYIDELDGLLARADAGTGGLLEGASIRVLLDDMVSNEMGMDGDFESTFGVWLGDTAAIGVTDFATAVAEDPDEDMPVIFSLEISDSQAAQTFFEANMPGDYITKPTPDGVLFIPDIPSRYDPAIYLGADVMLIRPSALEPTSLLPNFDASLADSTKFTDAFGGLPGDDYDNVIYFDYDAMAPVMDQMQVELQDMGMVYPFNIEDFFAAIDPLAVGLTIHNDDSLVMDIALSFDPDMYQSLMGITMPDYAPIDLAFADKLPADTMLMMQSTNLGAGLTQQMAMLEQMSNTPGMSQEEAQALQAATAFMTLSFEGMMGMTIEEAFGWMSGNTAIWVSAFESDGMLPMLPDVGVMVEVTDAEAANRLSEAVPQMLFELGLETVDENGVAVLPILGELAGDSNVDILFANTGDVLVNGTRYGTQQILDGAGGLTQTANFQAASATFLPDPHMLLYFDGASAARAAQVGAELTGERDLADLATGLQAIESMNITAHYTEDNVTMRMVFTLAGE